jgi:hypothetical protein
MKLSPYLIHWDGFGQSETLLQILSKIKDIREKYYRILST